MRKPEQAIFLHTAKSLGLEPEQCVFIDDIEANVAAAAACRMTGVHHTEAAQTAAALQDLLGVPLDGAAPSPGPDPSPGPNPSPEPGRPTGQDW
jgi:putative hydrolase of the HAD superfamily